MTSVERLVVDQLSLDVETLRDALLVQIEITRGLLTLAHDLHLAIARLERNAALKQADLEDAREDLRRYVRAQFN